MKRVLIKLDYGPRLPPREFLIFPYGEISTRKGTFQLTERSADMVMRLYQEHGVDIMFDYEHLGLKPEATRDGKAPAAGSCKLELRDDGIWLTNIRWTETAAEHLRQGEYRYLSPAFNINPKTGEIVELINVALTNLPATDNIPALVSASRLASRRNSGSDQSTRSLARKGTMSRAHPMAKHLKEHMAKHEMSSKDMAEKCGIAADRMKKLTDGHAPSQEEMKKCGKFLGLSHERMKKMAKHHADEETGRHDEDHEEASRDEADEEHSVNGTDPDDNEGPDEDDDDIDDDDDDDEKPKGKRTRRKKASNSGQEVDIGHSGQEADENRGDAVPTSRISLERDEEEGTVTLSRETIEALTGEKDPKKQATALATLSRKAQRYDEDHEAIVQLTRDNEDRERRELVALGRKDHKLTPESEKFWKAQPVATFREWLKTAPVVAGTDGGELQQLTPSGVEGVALTREEVEVCTILASDPRELAEFKKDMAGAEPFRMSRKVQNRLLNSFLGRPTDLDAA